MRYYYNIIIMRQLQKITTEELDPIAEIVEKDSIKDVSVMYYIDGEKTNPKQTKRPSQKVVNYIKNRLDGQPKGIAAKSAGYADFTAKTPSVIEESANYIVTMKQLIHNTSIVALRLTETIDKFTKNGEVEKMNQYDLTRLKTISAIQKDLATTMQILTPKITLKEETRPDGTIKRTKWGEMGATMSTNMQEIG